MLLDFISKIISVFYDNKTRAKIVLVPLGVTALLVIVLLGLRLIWGEKEPLTPRQITEKKDWTKQELIVTMSRMSIQRHRKNRGIPKEVYKHIRKQLKKLPEKDRREVTLEVMRNSIRKGRELWRSLEPKARENLLKKMKKEATKNRQASEQMTSEEKAQVKEFMSKPETQKLFEEVQNVSLNQLSPEERRDLAPIVREWVQTIENL